MRFAAGKRRRPPAKLPSENVLYAEGYRRTGRRQARKITPNNLKLGAINSRNGRILTVKCQTTPLVLGSEGAGVIEGGDDEFPNGSRVMFMGPFGLFESGTFAEYVAVPRGLLGRIPDNVTDVEAAGIPVAYLTAYLALKNAGFAPGKVIFAPAIGGSIGNAATQLAKALGARDVEKL